ncbi:MAG: SMP-30/gluconolactonase/LRE family protein [Chloroflexi bacterium]|nr:SMP-30/gluconolactonase/LRE family protein [Chloroflexota bacterium]
MSATVVLDPRLADLVDPSATPEQIASGCVFTEGPLWSHRDQWLTFSDVRGNTMYRWTESGGQQVFRKPSQVANGNTYDLGHNIVTCEHQGRRVSRTSPDGRIETVVDRYDGKRLNSPNDVICLANGDLIFTDPPYGLRQPDGTFAPGETPFNGVYRVSASDGSIRLLVDDFERPNGLVLRDDGRTLLIDDTDRHHVRAFDVNDDGSLSNDRVFAEVTYGSTVGRPDGMKLDVLGNLYVTANTEDGLWVYAPDGAPLGFIGTPEPPANCAWGGPGNRMLFITANTGVYRLTMKVSGQAIHANQPA